MRIFDTSAEQTAAACEYVRRSAAGTVVAAGSVEGTVRGAWMVVEAVPEKLELKRRLFCDLDRLAESDAILASNSSSLPTSLFIDGLTRPERVLNTRAGIP